MIDAYLILLGVWGAALIISVLHHLPRRWISPQSENETPVQSVRWMNVAFSDLVFYTLIPGVILVLAYPILPFSGYRAGLALAFVAALLGTIPFAVMLVVRQQRRIPNTVHDLFFQLCKMFLCFGLIGAFYPP